MPSSENVDYRLLAKQIDSLAEEEARWVPLLSNVSALIFDALDALNWAGFYLRDGEGLVLGPFQGKVACVHIASGKGVCGTALAEDATQLVANVHEFPGHIACDSASNSEIVIPLHDANGRVVAVLDIDSPEFNRFTQEDREGLELVAQTIEHLVSWQPFL